MREHIGIFRRILRPGSLRLQLLVRSLLVLAALFVLIGTLQFLFMRDFLYRNKAEALNAQLMSLPPDLYRPGVKEPGIRHPGRVRPDSPLLFQPGFSLIFIEESGEAQPVTEDGSIDRKETPLLDIEGYHEIRKKLQAGERSDYQLITSDNGKQYMAVFRMAARPGDRGSMLQAAVETESLRNQLLTQVAIFAALAAAALIAGLLLYLPLLRRTLHPLSKIVRAAELTDAGSLDTRLPERQGQSEIDSLSEAFNSMLVRLDAAFAQERATNERMRRFIADASHELKTPLTSLHGFIEVLLRGAAADKEQLMRALASMKTESVRVNKLVEDLLQLVRLEQPAPLKLEAARLDLLLEEMEPQLALLAGNRRYVVQATTKVTALIHRDKLKQVVLNLFHNAVQHTDAETGVIEVILSDSGDTARLEVRDNGSGIAPGHLPYVFERFYRGDESRSRARGGTGLGLAITQSIVEAHHGHIEVVSGIGVGTSFLITLPLNDDQPLGPHQ
ncbi:HAMP domain-containing protein [Paenibacillus sp. 1011MAR3C5]|uniref:sensor histidine kinase n=1 Tax=Paenibacillus sp. 1011MAR3C5 TaxID=1675787 RepID=UPI000E6B5684|nr:HAMP domain-containing sensor histidine kinase [Paenibacillus sp. 1011MAR3C5]RJE90953.1 HAMP domain-containing protein [Paenibacillus sp. 1011MAR3C5]